MAQPSAAPVPLALDQSKSPTPQPSVVFGSVIPVLLHGMIIVLLFIIHVCLSARGNTWFGQLAGHVQGGGAGGMGGDEKHALEPVQLMLIWRGSASCTFLSRFWNLKTAPPPVDGTAMLSPLVAATTGGLYSELEHFPVLHSNALSTGEA